jgi:hypothetical protein
MAAELLIQNGNKVFIPVVQEDIQWTTERKGNPGKLTFKVHLDDVLDITEGNAVRLKWNGANIFYGFIFSKKMDKERIITVTAYDQLRYLKNKDTYVYKNKTAGEVIQMICADFQMQTGSIEDTGFKIASMVEDNQTLFDIIQNALDATMENQKYMYVMYDDFGKVTLKGLDNMRLNLLIDEETGQNFDYTSSIDENTYNRIKLVYDNEDSGQRDVYISQDSNNINNWGVLQYYDTLQKGENGQANADAQLARVKEAGFDTYMIQVDGMYKIQVGAYSKKENADAMLAKIKAAGFDAFISTKGGQAVSASTPVKKTIQVGSTVRVNQGAKTYSGGGLASFVYKRNHKVSQLQGDRAVITYEGTVVAAVHVSDLTLV